MVINLKRNEYTKKWKHNQYIQRKKEHRCYNCGKGIKPILVYKVRCEDCLSKGRMK